MALPHVLATCFTAFLWLAQAPASQSDNRPCSFQPGSAAPERPALVCKRRQAKMKARRQQPRLLPLLLAAAVAAAVAPPAQASGGWGQLRPHAEAPHPTGSFGSHLLPPHYTNPLRASPHPSPLIAGRPRLLAAAGGRAHRV